MNLLDCPYTPSSRASGASLALRVLSESFRLRPYHHFACMVVRRSALSKKLTKKLVENLGPGRHGDGKGLYLVVDPSGARRWIVRMTVKGQKNAKPSSLHVNLDRHGKDERHRTASMACRRPRPAPEHNCLPGAGPSALELAAIRVPTRGMTTACAGCLLRTRANPSALALTVARSASPHIAARLGETAPLRSPSFAPRAFAAARASLVRREIASHSYCATRAMMPPVRSMASGMGA